MKKPAQAYSIPHFGRKPAFSSFLPGVAGERGIPLWCFYVNRGQCIAGFGSQDKNHSIMEFSPANTAYQRVPACGFRTFVKVKGCFCEPFSDGLGDMHIGENTLSLSWQSDSLRMDVDYFIAPCTDIGMLMRRAKLTNLSSVQQELEVLDGLAAIVPFGLSQHDLKMMGQTAKAWMMTEGLEDRLPYFRLRSSLADTTSVKPIEDGSFGAATAGDGWLSPVVDPAVIFGWDTSFARPEGFLNRSLADLLLVKQRTENELPCCFFAWQGPLAPGDSVEIRSVFGLSHGLKAFHPLASALLSQDAFESNFHQAQHLLDPYTAAIRTQTADALFDRYCRQSYIDNFLRGGVPRLFASGEQSRVFYLYSRKHGDLERDYNDFVITPEYASQGNGNFRDVLQNRRSDVRFCPSVGIEPLKPFLELIQPDGYNPLVIQPVTYRLADPAPFADRVSAQVYRVLESPFTPGDLMKSLSAEEESLISEILCASQPQVNASFGEGYWVDHWVYLLDMLESYLSIYPEKKTEVLFKRDLRWRGCSAFVLPLAKRWVMENGRLRQHHALDHTRTGSSLWLEDRSGCTIKSTMAEKLFMLCMLKFLTLDASGEAISMEAGKPGWYDALNGLPGLFGSSTPECFEIWRTLHFLSDALADRSEALQLPSEMMNLCRSAAVIAKESDPYKRWEQAHRLLESYRESVLLGVGESMVMDASEALSLIQQVESCVSQAVCALIQRTDGALPTYFTNLPSDEHFAAFDHRALPPFLEGPMHALRLPLERSCKKRIVDQVRASALFDEELQMYKVSSDLSGETPELGRANAFTRGWLEHESIWLHMEYKYLLELLKNGFYEDFFRDFENALIPFQPPERYGRSVLENASFLASSANPDPSAHGRGFVARLSGATAEFLEMWQILFFGKQPFEETDSGLSLTLCPTLPIRLIPDDHKVCATFLGDLPVTYYLPARENITPKTHVPALYELTDRDGKILRFEGASLPHEAALAVRSGLYRCASVKIRRR